MTMSPRISAAPETVLGYRRNGRPIFPIAGGSEPPNQPPAPAPGTDPAPAPAPTPPTPPAPRTFTQEEMNAIATREAAAAQRTAQQQLLQSLGVTDADALKTLVDNAKAAEEAGKTELQKQQDAAAKAAQDAAADRAAAATERFEAKVERAFARAGIETEDPKFARLRRMVTLDPSADVAAIDAELTTLKTDFPGLFGAPTGGGTPPPAPGSDPKGTPPPTPPGSKSAIERGRERAKVQAARSSNQPGGGYITPPGL